MDLVTLLVAIIVLAVVFWLLSHYVAPMLPAPWGNAVLAIFALIVVAFLLGLIFPGLRTVRVGG